MSGCSYCWRLANLTPVQRESHPASTERRDGYGLFTWNRYWPARPRWIDGPQRVDPNLLRRVQGYNADLVIVDEPFATVHAEHDDDCRCELLGEVEEAALALSRQMHPGAEVSIEIEDRGPDGIYVSELVEYPRNPMRGWLAKWFNRMRGGR